MKILGIICRFKTAVIGGVALFVVSCLNVIPADGKYGGIVVKIIDGDSVVVMRGGEKKTIRLYGVDAPEWDQPFASLAKKYLKSRILNKKVVVQHLYEDSYERSIALLSFQDMNLNQALVEKGYAWVHRYYCKKKFCSNWLTLEDKARESKRGLWLEENPTPPWRWKHR